MIVCHLLVYTVHAKITRTVILVLVTMDTLEQIVIESSNVIQLRYTYPFHNLFQRIPGYKYKYNRSDGLCMYHVDKKMTYTRLYLQYEY
jgi:hypothetical protein